MSSLVVCVLSLSSLIGAYDLKLCKLIRNSLPINNYDFTTRSSPFNLLTGMHKFSVTNPQKSIKRLIMSVLGVRYAQKLPGQ